MKKLFLIPLMAMLCTVMAWGATVEVGTIGDLRDAINNAANGDVIEVKADINFGQLADRANSLNIKKSITINGNNHTLNGNGLRPNKSSNRATLWINQDGDQTVNVTINDLTVINPWDGGYSSKAIETRGQIGTLTLNNVSLESYGVPLQIGGNQASNAIINMTDCKLRAITYYCIMSYNPYTLTANNCEFNGWNALYFKGVDSSAGSRGSVATLTNCNLNCPNPYDTPTNAFAMFVCEDDGISITLNNCGMHAEQLGNQTQTVFMLSNFASKTRRSQSMNFVITGDNSYINGKLVSYSGWAAGWYNNAPSDAAIPDPCPLSITISGGTYAFNPANQGWLKNQTYETDEELYDDSNIGTVTIPSGYEVKEIKTYQGTDSTILYRVRKEITTSYEINDNAEGKGDGQNKNTEFIITGDGNDQSVGTVTNDTVVANYIEVSNEATLTVADEKVLVVTNGMDVTGGAQVIAEAGSTIIIGEGGITSESSESIVITADSTGSASFLLDPDVIVNTNPVLTVRMYVEAGKYSEDSYSWHRFAMPVQGITSWTKEDKDGNPYTVPTYLQRWDYNADAWASCYVTDMVPFLGYALTYDFTAETDAAKVTYVFKGNLCGNQDQQIHFQDRGFNFFGNSYTAYVDARTLLQGVIDDENVGGTVYLWNAANQTYSDVTIKEYRDNYGELAPFEREIAPMHTFILQKRGVNDPNVEVNYRDAIWNNPRYGNAPASAPARVQITDNASVRINVTSASGDNDRVKLYQNNEYTDAFDNGADATKFMNANHINLFVTVDDEDLASVATDNLAGKALSLQTLNDVDYTMSFSYVNGTQYALRDLMTNIVTPMTEGNTYTFAAQPNTTIEGRFVIVPMQNMPTDVETVENNTTVKGIYTIMGQYVGETSDWETLPAGVYVIDGVKVVK